MGGQVNIIRQRDYQWFIDSVCCHLAQYSLFSLTLLLFDNVLWSRIMSIKDCVTQSGELSHLSGANENGFAIKI